MLVCVGIPSIDGKPHANTVDSLLADTVLGYAQGVHFLVMWQIGCSLIGPARNKLARRFLDTKADRMVFVDSDISWKAGTLLRLAQRPEDVIGGTYRAKTEDETFHVRGIPEKHGDLMKVEGLPGGFLKVSRDAFATIDAPTYHDSQMGCDMKDFFPTGLHNGEMWGEDYGFCRQWREAGGDVWLDPSIILRHHDGTMAYSGDPATWIERALHA